MRCAKLSRVGTAQRLHRFRLRTPVEDEEEEDIDYRSVAMPWELMVYLGSEEKQDSFI